MLMLLLIVMNRSILYSVLLVAAPFAMGQTSRSPSASSLVNQEYDQGGRKVRVQEIAPPKRTVTTTLAPRDQRVQLTEQQVAELRAESQIQTDHFIISATIYNNRATFLRFWSIVGEQQTVHECWSNINWNHLTSISSFTSSFEENEESFTYVLIPSNVSLQELREVRRPDRSIQVPRIPRELPRYRNGGARYFMVSDEVNEGREEALDFMEAIHAYYDAERRNLRATYQQQEVQKAAIAKELKENPPKPEDITIRFWSNK